MGALIGRDHAAPAIRVRTYYTVSLLRDPMSARAQGPKRYCYIRESAIGVRAHPPI
jgi:hypothetical protein